MIAGERKQYNQNRSNLSMQDQHNNSLLNDSSLLVK